MCSAAAECGYACAGRRGRRGGAGLRQVEVSGGARVLLGAANDASLYVWELYGRLGSNGPESDACTP